VVIDNDDRFYAPGVIFMTCGTAGYTGLVRLEDDRLDLACALDAGAVRSAHGPGEVVRALIAQAGWPVPVALDEQPWRGTVPLSRQAQRVADHRLFALGDATGYVEPFTGEGIAWALASAVAVTPLALAGIRAWRPGLAVAWKRLHERVVTRRQLACRLLAGVLRRPWLTAAVVSALSRLPSLAVPVLQYLNHTNGVNRHPRSGHTLSLRDLP
jgi:flavin-dependent dehydrogenase